MELSGYMAFPPTAVELSPPLSIQARYRRGDDADRQEKSKASSARMVSIFFVEHVGNGAGHCCTVFSFPTSRFHWRY